MGAATNHGIPYLQLLRHVSKRLARADWKGKDACHGSLEDVLAGILNKIPNGNTNHLSEARFSLPCQDL